LEKRKNEKRVAKQTTKEVDGNEKQIIERCCEKKMRWKMMEKAETKSFVKVLTKRTENHVHLGL